MRLRVVLLGVVAGLFASGSGYGQTASILTPTISKYGYPWSALAGSDRNAYVTPIAETDSITHGRETGTRSRLRRTITWKPVTSSTFAR